MGQTDSVGSPTVSATDHPGTSPTLPLSIGALAGTIENAAKLAGAIGVIGYLSLRSHLNFLGVSSQTALSLDRYLMEAYQFFSALLFNVDYFLIAPIIILSVWISGWIRDRISTHLLSRWPPVSSLLKHHALPWFLIVSACCLILVEARVLTDQGIGAVVGSVAKAEHAAEVRQAHGDLVYAMAGFSLLIFWLGSSCSGSDLSSQPVARTISLVLAFLLALQLPIVYGALVRPTLYATVEVRTKDAVFCRVLVLETTDNFVLWRATKGEGSVDILPKSSVESQRIVATVDLLNEAKMGKTSNRPGCPDSMSDAVSR